MKQNTHHIPTSSIAIRHYIFKSDCWYNGTDKTITAFTTHSQKCRDRSFFTESFQIGQSAGDNNKVRFRSTSRDRNYKHRHSCCNHRNESESCSHPETPMTCCSKHADRHAVNSHFQTQHLPPRRIGQILKTNTKTKINFRLDSPNVQLILDNKHRYLFQHTNSFHSIRLRSPTSPKPTQQSQFALQPAVKKTCNKSWCDNCPTNSITWPPKQPPTAPPSTMIRRRTNNNFPPPQPVTYLRAKTI